MGGDVGAGGDFCAVAGVVGVGAEEHFLVGEGGVPTEGLLDVGGVEDEGLSDHFVVVGAEGREVELVGELHGGDGGGLGEGADF